MSRPAIFAMLMVLADLAAGQEIGGRVTEDHSGAPVASVEVRVRRTGTTRLIADIETDRGGQFHLPQLPPGDYNFEFLKANYLPTRLRFTGSVPAAVTARLVRCGSIAGRVLDPDGRPVRGAVVYAMPKPAGGGPLRPLANLPTGSYSHVDGNGGYRLYYLLPGEYAVAVAYGASSMVLGMTGSASVVPGVGSGVAIYPNSPRPQFLTVAGGEEHRDIDLNLPLATFFKVSGKVEAPPGVSNPERGERFWLTLVSTTQPSLSTAAVTADAQGAFRFEGIAPGSYYLLTSGPSSARNQRGAILPAEPWFARNRVDVVAHDLEGIVVSPRKGAAVSFRMTAPPGAKSACPAGAQLTLTALEDWSAQLERTTPVNSAGEQSLANLAPARYTARLANLGDLCYQAADVTVDLSAGGSETVAIPIGAGGAIRGKLVGAGGVSGFAVALLPVDADLEDRPVRAAVPDANGAFTFDGLRPGKYYIAAQPAGAPKSRWISDPSRMIVIDVRGGSYTDLELPAAMPVEGGRQ